MVQSVLQASSPPRLTPCKELPEEAQDIYFAVPVQDLSGLVALSRNSAQMCMCGRFACGRGARSGARACVPSTTMTTSEIEERNTPPSMAAAAHIAYRPGWMLRPGSHCMASRPKAAPKELPTCRACRQRPLLSMHVCMHA